MDHFHSHLKLPEDRAYRIIGSVENTGCIDVRHQEVARIQPDVDA